MQPETHPTSRVPFTSGVTQIPGQETLRIDPMTGEPTTILIRSTETEVRVPTGDIDSVAANASLKQTMINSMNSASASLPSTETAKANMSAAVNAASASLPSTETAKANMSAVVNSASAVLPSAETAKANLASARDTLAAGSSQVVAAVTPENPDAAAKTAGATAGTVAGTVVGTVSAVGEMAYEQAVIGTHKASEVIQRNLPEEGLATKTATVSSGILGAIGGVATGVAHVVAEVVTGHLPASTTAGVQSLPSADEFGNVGATSGLESNNLSALNNNTDTDVVTSRDLADTVPPNTIGTYALAEEDLSKNVTDIRDGQSLTNDSTSGIAGAYGDSVPAYEEEDVQSQTFTTGVTATNDSIYAGTPSGLEPEVIDNMRHAQQELSPPSDLNAHHRLEDTGVADLAGSSLAEDKEISSRGGPLLGDAAVSGVVIPESRRTFEQQSAIDAALASNAGDDVGLDASAPEFIPSDERTFAENTEPRREQFYDAGNSTGQSIEQTIIGDMVFSKSAHTDSLGTYDATPFLTENQNEYIPERQSSLSNTQTSNSRAYDLNNNDEHLESVLPSDIRGQENLPPSDDSSTRSLASKGRSAYGQSDVDPNTGSKFPAATNPVFVGENAQDLTSANQRPEKNISSNAGAKGGNAGLGGSGAFGDEMDRSHVNVPQNMTGSGQQLTNTSHPSKLTEIPHNTYAESLGITPGMHSVDDLSSSSNTKNERANTSKSTDAHSPTKQHHVGLMDKIIGKTEVGIGKIAHKPEMIAAGKERMVATAEGGSHAAAH